MGIVLDGRNAADAISQRLAAQIEMAHAPRPPKLLAFRRPRRPSPFAHEIVSSAISMGVDVECFEFSHLDAINQQMICLGNRDNSVDGIILIDSPDGIGRIRPDKDVDCHDGGRYRPAVAMAVDYLLDAYDFTVNGREAVVVGRSKHVGLPIAMGLLDRGATVTICHSGTVALSSVTRRADLIVSCTGVDDLIGLSDIRLGAWVIDVGHDVFRSVSQIAGAVTPEVGGIGPLTVVSVLENTVDAWARHFAEVDGH